MDDRPHRRAPACEQGITPSYSTVIGWVGVGQAAKQRRRLDDRNARISAARSGRLGAPHDRREMQETRIRALRDAGMTVENIRRVMAFDYPDSGWDRRPRVEKVLA